MKIRLAMFLILFGVFFPSFLYPFTTLDEDSRESGVLARCSGGSYSPRISGLVVIVNEEYEILIPYKCIVSLGILFIFVGLSFLLFCDPSSIAAQPTDHPDEK